MKRINEVFYDCNAGENINIAFVEGVVISKKTKTLELKIKSDKYIDINEIKCLNDFIKNRFALNDSKIVINYIDGANKRPIEDELSNIIHMLSEKYPALKSILRNSEFEVQEYKINFIFKMAVSEFLPDW